MATPDLLVELAFGDPPLTANASATWTDVSEYVKVSDERGNNTILHSIKRGRRNEFSEIEPGDATIVLNNADYRFDPQDSTGPYFGDIKPMVKIRIGAVWDDGGGPDTYWLFNGYVERWDVQYQAPGISTCTLTCVDAFKYFAMIDIVAAARPEEESGTRIDAALDAISWPAGDRAIAVGDIDVAAMPIDQSMLSLAQTIARAERGLFFMSPAGNATFQDRSLRNTMTAGDPLWTNNVTGADEYKYAGFTTRYDDSEIWNQVTMRRPGGIAQSVLDATSQTDFFTRILTMDNLPFVDDAAALEAADYALAQFKDARVRPDSLRIVPSDLSWPIVLGYEISDVVAIDHKTLDHIESGFTASFSAFIEGIQWRIRKGRWEVTYPLSPNFTVTPATGTQNTTDDWFVPTLINSWTDYGSPTNPAGYRKEGEWVYLRGVVDSGADGTAIFVLPEGFRPVNNNNLPTVAATGFAYILVEPDGDVVYQASGSSPWVSLDSISFRVI